MNIEEKRKLFEKLWIDGGGHFNYFIYSAPLGQYVINGKPHNFTQDEMLSALTTLNTAYVFYLGGWSQSEALKA